MRSVHRRQETCSIFERIGRIICIAAFTLGLGSLLHQQPSTAASSSLACEFNNLSLDTCSIYQPKSGPTFDTVVQPGNLRVSIPGSDVYDHWSFVDSAPQVRLRVPAGNWEMTAKLKVNRPTTLQAYHTGLMVYFSQFDLFYWGLYRGQEVRLERSGFTNVLSVGFVSREVEFLIAKNGNTYAFSYRSAGSDSWTLAGCKTAPESPQFVGLISKTWSPTELVVDFDYLRVNDLQPSNASFGCPTLYDFGFGGLRADGSNAEGTRPLLVIIIKFNQSQIPFAYDREYYDRLIFGPGFPNVVDLYREISYGQFTWSRADVVGPFMMDDTGDLPRNLARAKEVAAAGGFDFSHYDGNRDGRITTDELGILMIDNLTRAGGATRVTDPPCVQPIGSTVTVCSSGSAVGEEIPLTTIAHELLHEVGADFDVYGNLCHNQRLTFMTSCDPSGTFHLDPWFKVRFGWVKPVLISTESSSRCEVLNSATTSDYRPVILYEPRRGTNEMFILESRTPASYDQNVLDGGIAIWYVQTGADHIPIIIPPLQEPKGQDRAFFLIGPPAPGAARVDGLWKEVDGEAQLKWLDGNDSGVRLRVGPSDVNALSRVIRLGFGGSAAPDC